MTAHVWCRTALLDDPAVRAFYLLIELSVDVRRDESTWRTRGHTCNNRIRLVPEHDAKLFQSEGLTP